MLTLCRICCCALIVVGVARHTAAQPQPPQPAQAQPAVAPNPMATPTCQWGRCATFCNEVCPHGSVCGVDGTCVQVESNEDLAREVENIEQQRRDAIEEKQDAIRSRAARQRAHYLPRLSLGAGIGNVTLVGTHGRSGLFVGQIGLREQLYANIGVHAQFMGAYGYFDEHDAAGNSHPVTLSEVAGTASADFGPFERFYIGPAVLAGYRWYSDAFVQWFASVAHVENHVLREGGARLGILAGTQEQFDISALVTTSFDRNTPFRGIVTLAYEFR